MKPRLLVLGSSGQLASALAELGTAGPFTLTCLGRPALDLARAAEAETAVRSLKPDIIINAAAYTAVDRAEAEPETAHAINAEGPGHLSGLANTLGIPFIHVSSDYVFDGSKPTPWLETDPVNPLSAYGRSKLAGELAVAGANPRHVILRTSWVYHHSGQNFLLTMRRLAAEGKTLRVVADQFGAPTSAALLAGGLLQVASKLMDEPSNAALNGIFHMTSSGHTSWHGFAQAILGPGVQVDAISSADYPVAAKRPRNSRLDCSKLQATYGIRLPDWREGLAQCMEHLPR